jgi:FAD/FMN-containing dehydrogenase
MSVMEELRKTVRGGIFRPGDDRYDFERRSWHLAIDPRPAIIVEAADRADVRACLVAAREHGVPFAVQATGHGTLTPADGGVLVKTSKLVAVEVDPQRRTARVGPGTRWSAVIDAAAPFGLAPLSGTASIGVTGYTLGGGLGWLSRTYGFAADSLIRTEVVTADGRVVAASAGEHPDLFWALRGGGANFGVVTSLEFHLYPVAWVYAGMSLHAIDRAPATLARYRDWAGEEPDQLTTAVTLLQMPPAPEVPEPVRGRRVLAVRALYLGEAEPAERLLRPLLDAAGPPIMNGFRSMTFPETSTITGPPPPPTAVAQHLDLFRELPDAALDVLLDTAGEGAGSPAAAVELRHWGGAMSRPSPDAGPAGHRDLPFSALVRQQHFVICDGVVA